MIRTLIAAAGLAAAGAANAAFVGGVFRVDAAASAQASIDIGQAVTVTRMYIAFSEADDRLVSFGDANFSTNTGTNLYQDVAFGADNQAGINPSFFAFPGVNSEYDSYTGIGGPNFTGSGFGDSNDPDFMFTANGVVGGWFTTPNGAGVFPGSGAQVGSNWEVFAGQFTVLGDWTEQGVVGDGFIASDIFLGVPGSRGGFPGGITVNWVEVAGAALSNNRVDIREVPAPGAAALFGMAGLTAARRRRG